MRHFAACASVRRLAVKIVRSQHALMLHALDGTVDLHRSDATSIPTFTHLALGPCSRLGARAITSGSCPAKWWSWH